MKHTSVSVCGKAELTKKRTQLGVECGSRHMPFHDFWIRFCFVFLKTVAHYTTAVDGCPIHVVERRFPCRCPEHPLQKVEWYQYNPKRSLCCPRSQEPNPVDPMLCAPIAPRWNAINHRSYNRSVSRLPTGESSLVLK